MTGRHVGPAKKFDTSTTDQRVMPAHRAGDHPYDTAPGRRFRIHRTTIFPDSPWRVHDRRSGRAWHVNTWQGAIELAQALTR